MVHEEVVQQLRARAEADIRAGKTVVLSAQDLGDPELRSQLPTILQSIYDSTPPPAPAPGIQVEGHRILAQIGQGGMSAVYLAEHIRLGRKVAVKVLPHWLANHEKARQRMAKEARALASVEHPHVIDIHDVFDRDDTLALSIEWVDGVTLRQLVERLAAPGTATIQGIAAVLGDRPESLRKRGRDWVPFVVGLMRDVAMAVHAVHEAKLLHLDIKPSNILVRRDGVAKLADFGVVREIDLYLSHTGSFAGTPVYAAPEQLRRDDRAIGRHTDVYGLGITLYEALARRQPVQKEGLTQILLSIERGEVPPIGTAVEIPKDLENIVHRAIDPDPRRRYPTARAFAEDLQALLEMRPVTARALPRRERLVRWVRKEPWKAGLAAAMAVLLPGLAVLLTQLSLQQPTVAREAARRQHALAVEHLQSAWHARLDAGYAADVALDELDAATAAQPDSPLVLASCAAIYGQFLPARAQQLLAARPALVTAHPGLRLLQERAAADRRYFTDQEREALATDKDVCSRLVCAFDLLLLAGERADRQLYQKAVDLLRGLNGNDGESPDPDPLLHGLQCFAAAKEGDDTELQIARQALERWQDRKETTLWRMAIEPDRTLELAAPWLQQAEPPPRIALKAATALLDQGQKDQALALLDRLEQHGTPTRLTRSLRLQALVGSGRDAFAALRAALADPATPPPRGAAEWNARGVLLLASSSVKDIDLAIECFQKGLRAEDPSRPWPAPDPRHAGRLNLNLAVALSLRSGSDTNARLAAIRKAVELQPEQATFHNYLGVTLMDATIGLFDEASREFEHIRPRLSRLIAKDASLSTPALAKMASCYLMRGEYEHLLQVASAWSAMSTGTSSEDDRRRMLMFLGLALSRTGESLEAVARLKQHIELGLRMSKGGQPKVQAEAALELAWLLVEPREEPATGGNNDVDLDEARRQLAIAIGTSRNRQSMAFRKDGRCVLQGGPVPGPWTLCVQAEVQYRGGERGAALASIAQARKELDTPEPFAPYDLEQRLDRAEKRYQQ